MGFNPYPSYVFIHINKLLEKYLPQVTIKEHMQIS